MSLNILKTFCRNTNIHGFIYMVQSRRHVLEKIFWLIMIFISFALTGILIYKLIIESKKNPIVIYTDQNVINVEDLYFPAVSICPGMVYKTECRTILDYDGIKFKLENHKLHIKNLTIDQLKLMQVASLVARDRFMSEKFPTLSISTDDFIEKFKSFNDQLTYEFDYTPSKKPGYVTVVFRMDKPPTNFKACWASDGASGFKVFVRHWITQFGPCYTFNMADVKEVFQENKISSYFMNMTLTELQGCGFESSNKTSFPARPPKPDSHFTFGLFSSEDNCHLKTIKTLKNNHFAHTVPEISEDNFMLRPHNPYEIMSTDAPKLHMAESRLLRISVNPVVTKIDATLMNVDADLRSCYLKDEYQLEFFKIYTKINCEHECWTRMTLNSCGCVQYFMVRNETTRICGVVDEKCFTKVEEKFEQAKISCKCYEPCENIKYEMELAGDVNHDYRPNIRKLKMEFGIRQVFATSRKVTYSTVEFLSFVGGLLGLFAGFSVICGIEVFYYIIIHPITSWRQKIQPFIDDEEGRNEVKASISKVIQEMFRNSSIDGFKLIVGERKSVLERLIWILIFLISMVLSYFMMRNVHRMFQDTTIVIGVEATPTNVRDIPFPAITLVPQIDVDFETFFDNYLYEEYDDEEIGKLITQFRSLVCNRYAHGQIYNFRNTSSLVMFIRDGTRFQGPWFEKRKALWNGKNDTYFTEVLTSTLFGYSFNLMEQSKLMDRKLLSPDLHYDYKNLTNLEFPWKTSAHVGAGLTLELNLFFKLSFQLGCLGYHKILIHSPNELPLHDKQTIISKDLGYDIQIQAEVIKSDPDLKKLDINYRKCYFEGERTLKIYKIYTEENCKQECLSHIIYETCTCLPYYFIRNSTQTVCDEYSRNNCYLRLVSLMNFSDYNHLFPSHGVCMCLPPCNYVRYSYKMYRHDFHLHMSDYNTLLTVRWKDSEYYALFRYQQLKLVDFLSYVGGILGLFAGISVLSIVEIFYFLTLRLVNDFIRLLRI